MTADAKFVETLEAISHELDELEKQEKMAIDLKTLCDKYQKVKGMLEYVLPFIEKIPMSGKNIADAIRFLMKMAELGCSVT